MSRPISDRATATPCTVTYSDYKIDTDGVRSEHFPDAFSVGIDKNGGLVIERPGLTTHIGVKLWVSVVLQNGDGQS